MNYENEQGSMMLKLYISASIVLLIIAGLIYYITTLKNDIRIGKSAQENKSIKTKIDSLKIKQTDVIYTLIKKSQSSADLANQITKTIKHEKIIIRDTTYAAMCEYLSNYRP